MFDYKKAVKNYEGIAYDKCKYDLIESQTSRVDVTDELKELCVDRFDKNYDVLKEYKRYLLKKKIVIYYVPFAAFAVASFLNFKKPPEVLNRDVYKLESTLISDGKMVTIDDNDTLYIKNKSYIKSGNYFEEIDGKNYYAVDNTNDCIKYQIKNGTRNIIFTIDIEDDGVMKLKSAYVDNFFALNTDIFKDVEETTLDEKYDELVSDIANFVLESPTGNVIGSPTTAKKELEELLKNEKTKVITSVLKYVKVDEIVEKQTMSSYLTRVAIVEAISLVIAYLLVIFFKWLTYSNFVYALEADKKKLRVLKDDDDLVRLTFFQTYNRAKKEFIKADDERKNEIKRIVNSSYNDEINKVFKYKK